MKQIKNNPLLKITLTQKFVIAFTIPVMTTLIIIMFVFVNFQHIQAQSRAVYQKIAQTKTAHQQTEVLKMLKKMDQKIKFTKIQLIFISLISIITTIMIGVLIIRVIQVQYKTEIPEHE